MIYKFFTSDENSENTIEFGLIGDGLFIYASDNSDVPENMNLVELTLTKKNLFDLKGGLLRIQAELKKGRE